MDRKKQPEIKPIEDFKIERAELKTLSNGIKLYILRQGEEDVVRLDWMLGAGNCYQDERLVASFTAQLLKEGTRSKSSSEIADELDFYGSWLQLSCSHQYAYVTFYALNKYLPKVMSLANEIIFEPTFPEKEFHTYKEIKKKQNIMDSQKVGYMAHYQFLKSLYGEEHPYGRIAEPKDFDNIKLEWIKEFHKKFYVTENCMVFVTGKVTDEVEKTICSALESIAPSGRKIEKRTSGTPYPDSRHRIFLEKKDSVQSAVVIGCPLFTRTDPDYHKFSVLNTLLGGYFGSRLMSNIREEKGYTYGIGSSITTFKELGHFSIMSQTGVEYTQPLIDEVFKEMDKLKKEEVSEEELNMVKMYMLGEHLRLVDGGLSIADNIISMVGNGLDYDFYDKTVSSINDTTAKDIKDLANKYFIPENFYTVIAGKEA
ncbi:MAG TPA: pitrilysin family protein [Paludibacteraceae bacterium]|nr:pitrilysin family protein [Paludibacteraceae bacterium]HOU67549.1 pitrilysin family protein [Paludibacteraceae bacterium]HPH62376.1 pitrilysin family protein [Paludibacteraceae bacterium]HQF49603.1 pitrilysin family protein [Paludibacteraceae bacterium]